MAPHIANNHTIIIIDSFEHSYNLIHKLGGFSLPTTFLTMGIIIFSNILTNSHINILKKSFGDSQFNIIALTLSTKIILCFISLSGAIVANYYIEFIVRFYISLTLIVIIAVVFLVEIMIFINNWKAVIQFGPSNNIYYPTNIEETDSKNEPLLKNKSMFNLHNNLNLFNKNIHNPGNGGPDLGTFKEKSKHKRRPPPRNKSFKFLHESEKIPLVIEVPEEEENLESGKINMDLTKKDLYKFKPLLGSLPNLNNFNSHEKLNKDDKLIDRIETFDKIDIHDGNDIEQNQIKKEVVAKFSKLLFYI